jgi:hypothetical protein
MFLPHSQPVYKKELPLLKKIPETVVKLIDLITQEYCVPQDWGEVTESVLCDERISALSDQKKDERLPLQQEIKRKAIHLKKMSVVLLTFPKLISQTKVKKIHTKQYTANKSHTICTDFSSPALFDQDSTFDSILRGSEDSDREDMSYDNSSTPKQSSPLISSIRYVPKMPNSSPLCGLLQKNQHNEVEEEEEIKIGEIFNKFEDENRILPPPCALLLSLPSAQKTSAVRQARLNSNLFRQSPHQSFALPLPGTQDPLHQQWLKDLSEPCGLFQQKAKQGLKCLASSKQSTKGSSQDLSHSRLNLIKHQKSTKK